jgi:polysaccharide biosynthesis transport protein
MPELNQILPPRLEHWPKPTVATGDATFERSEAKTGGATPLQVALRRKWAILAFAVFATIVVGLAVEQLPVRYTASASVMIDLRQPRLSNGESLLPTPTVDLELLRTYMEALLSPSLVVDVVQQLRLTTEPEYCAPPRHWGGAVSHLLARTRGDATPSASCRISVANAANKLAPSLGFGNDGRSYVISISAEAGNPALAAKIANAYANAFIARRRKDQVVLTDQADAWLTTHLAQLRADVLAADQGVQQQQQGGQLTKLGGQTLLDQSLTEMNSQLIVATSELAQKQSILQELKAATHSGAGTLDASAPILASPIIQKLLDREGTLAVDQAELSTRLGGANTELLANDAQLARVRQLIQMEIEKAVTSMGGEVEALQARRVALQISVRDLQTQVGKQSVADDRLQNLERDAASAHSRYDEASLRLEQIQVEGAMQRGDVQLLVEASAPNIPSFPRTRMIIAGTFMAMLGVGVGLAYALALLSRVFSTPEQVEDETGLHVLGLFPKSTPRRTKTPFALESHSREAEAVQAVFAGLSGGHHPGEAKADRVLMVTSASPGEGKTSFSVALGRAALVRGLSVVLVDCDLRRSSLRSHFPRLKTLRPPCSETAPGFAELAVDRSSGLHVLVAPRLPSNPHAILASAALRRTLEQLRTDYDLVIIDTPPVLAVPDVLSIAPLADKVVMLVAWRQTRRSSVIAALRALGRAQVHVSGVVLSKVDLRRFSRAHRDGSYYARLYPIYHALSRG